MCNSQTTRLLLLLLLQKFTFPDFCDFEGWTSFDAGDDDEQDDNEDDGEAEDGGGDVADR